MVGGMVTTNTKLGCLMPNNLHRVAQWDTWFAHLWVQRQVKTQTMSEYRQSMPNGVQYVPCTILVHVHVACHASRVI
jgi:hypothetical protein